MFGNTASKSPVNHIPHFTRKEPKEGRCPFQGPMELPFKL